MGKAVPTIWDCELLARSTLENSVLFREEFQSDRSKVAREAGYLIEGVWRISATQRLLMRSDFITEEQEKSFTAALQRRKAGEPLAYITGEKEFYGHTFLLNSHTLIPRADSETLIDMVCACPDFSQDQHIVFVDWGTGSGCLLVSLLYAFPHAIGLGIDKNAGALDVARENGLHHGMQNRLTWHMADWHQAHDLPAVPEHYDVVIISNPPYIPSDAISDLSSSVSDYEPHLALDGGKDGFCAIRKIFDLTAHYAKGTHFFMEIGKGQGDKVRSIAHTCGWQYRGSSPDMQDIERILHFSL